MPACFAPIAPPDARLLILGTMPSIQSLQQGQYYGNPQNAFWRILFDLWDEPLRSDYGGRVDFLLRHRIALWDVLQCCERQGSGDAAIRNPRPNDFAALSARCPRLGAICFNSVNARRWYEQLVTPDPLASLARVTLPSSSPARAMRYEDKKALWLPVRELWESFA